MLFRSQIKNYELNMVSASNNTNIINKSNNENVSLSSQLFSSNTFTTNKSGILSHLNTMTNNNGNTLNNTTNNNINANLPKTGMGDSLPTVLLVVVFGISAIYAYKKVSDYRNID